jgi:DNA-binding LacI/PurR family transcriptional regulator
MRKRDVTIHDVAAQSGVSYQTVSRVINEMPDVADATRQRVTKVLDRLGYRPNLTARHLVSRRSTVIGVVTFATGLYGPSQIVLNVERAARANGYNIMFAGIPEENVEEIHRAVDTLCAHRVAGILMHLPLEIDLRRLRDVCKTVPVVAIDSDFGFEVPSVFVQQEKASRMLTKHLIDLGHKQIAYLRAPVVWRASRLRYQGWLKALKAARLKPGPCIEGDWSSRGGFEATLELIKHHKNRFTALVAANDQMALGAIRAFEENGLQVPRDVSIVGFDDIPEAAFFRPPLTTVKQDFDAVGKLGVRCLIDQFNNETPPSTQTNTVRPIFFERASTAKPRRKNVSA